MVMASHELKTPLTVIMANLQIMLEMMKGTENVVFVEKVLKQVDKLSDLITNLLDVSKINDGETLTLLELLKSASVRLSQTINDQIDTIIRKDSLNVPLEELDLNDTLTTVLRSVQSLLEDSNARIEADFSELKNIVFNKIYLESIFLNLITNSIKYTQPDCSPRITICSKITNGKKQLIIADNGLGFDMAEVKDRLFG